MLTIKSCLPFPGCTEGKSLWQWLHSTWPGFCLDYISLKYFLAFQASPVLQPHEELDLVASSPQGLSLGPSPRNSYPLVVVAIRADLGDDVEDLTMVTSLLAVVHIKDSVCPIPTQVILNKT